MTWTVNLVEEGRLLEKTCCMVRLILLDTAVIPDTGGKAHLARGGGARARNQS